jgi:hypothetical protein
MTQPFRGGRVIVFFKANRSRIYKMISRIPVTIEMKFHKGDEDQAIEAAKLAASSRHNQLRLEESIENATTNTGQD